MVGYFNSAPRVVSKQRAGVGGLYDCAIYAATDWLSDAAGAVVSIGLRRWCSVRAHAQAGLHGAACKVR